MVEPVFVVLGLAFGLGMLHALDADHIAAVTALACERRSRRSALYYSLLWSGGHGLTLLLIGALVYLLGQVLPTSFSHYADWLVGIMLMLIGAAVILDIRGRRLRLRFHKHQGMPMHAHWHQPEHEQAVKQAPHTPLLVGTIHGASGAAPLLALLPYTAQQGPWLGMAYLLIFSLGVFVTMLFFGGVIEWLMRRLLNRASTVIRGIQVTVGSVSVFLGIWVMHGLA